MTIRLHWFLPTYGGEGVVPILRVRGLFKGDANMAAPAAIPFVGSAR
jgi:alkanesulfonate monooxygenase